MENKFKIGDKCIIVKYGNLIWENKNMEGQKSDLPTFYEDNMFRWVDINPRIIGKEVIIKGISSDGKSYKTDLFSWADEEQLELIKIKKAFE